MKKNKYEDVNAKPVKAFFVSMLTRDITLEEAILDLLDNCVDGILRTQNVAGKKPYENFYAEIELKEDEFSISDNCGGIPWKLHDYAFRMGRAANRPNDVLGTVGVYGIGMKRAIFKMGRYCLISTQNGKDRYDVTIDPEWIKDEELWKIPVEEIKDSRGVDGTTIVVGNLYPNVKKQFHDNKEKFTSDLIKTIAGHYAFIIDKGFRVIVNGAVVNPKPTKLVFDGEKQNKNLIRPFMFRTTIEGVSVFLAVGFTRPIPSETDVEAENSEKKHSSLEAGWTVICNDRAVLYCDKSELTGWGEADVPRYHTQFIAISGIVEFKSNDPSKLPMTTTKRGVDGSSTIYLQVKNKMREGMRLFTNYTNKWKSDAELSKKQIEAGDPFSIEELKIKFKKVNYRKVSRSHPTGEQYSPQLPMPRVDDHLMRRISYKKKIEDIEKVSQYLFSRSDESPDVVGEKCFDIICSGTKK